MSKTTNRLKVMDIPNNISEDVLRNVFSNQRRKGGGPIEHIQLNRTLKTAVITFENWRAVDLIMSRGPSVDIDGHKIFVKPYIVKNSAKKATTISGFDDAEPQCSSHISETTASASEQISKKNQARHDKVVRSSERKERTSDRVCRTIRAKVHDVTRHKDLYVLYLKDKNINDGEFEEDTIMLDGLRGYVFVTFYNAKDARSICRLHHREESNFVNVEMAIEDDFNIYPNLLSLHANNLNFEHNIEALQKFIENKTGVNVVNFIFYDEPKSVIVEFSHKKGKGSIETLSWLCSEEVFQNEHLTAAPVHKNNMLLVRNLNPKTTEYMLKRYFLSKCDEENQNIDVEQQGSHTIVTLRFERDVETILSEKTHKLEGKTLNISHYHPCLTAETYAQYFENLDLPHCASEEYFPQPSSRTSKYPFTKATVCPRESRHVENFKKYHDDSEVDIEKERDVECESEKVNTLQEKIELKKHELYLLLEINFPEHLEKTRNINVIVSDEECALMLKGTDKSNIKDAAIAILTKTKEIQSKHIMNLVPAQIEVLSKKYTQQKIIEKWRRKAISAYFQYKNEKITLFYLPTIDVHVITDVVESQVAMKLKHLNENVLQILSSQKGKSFISEQNTAMNDNQTCGYMELDILNKTVIYVGSYKVLDQLAGRVKDFADKCIFLEKRIEFPKIKQHFVERFYKSKMEQIIHNLQSVGINIEFHEDAWLLSGPVESIHQGAEDISTMCDRIASKVFTLNFVGITEFLPCPDGKRIVEEIETKHSCVISCEFSSEVNEASGGDISSIASSSRILSDQAITIATVTVNDCSIYFMQGDILSVDTDVVVNTLDASCTCRDSLGKAIISRGGEAIQRELKNSSENVIMTSSGRLQNCKSIIHVICPKTSVEIEDLRYFIMKCLKLASRKQYTSIAFPAVSIGKFFKFPDIAFAKMLIETFKAYLKNDEEDTRLTKIILCDFKSDNIKLVIERCQNTFKDVRLNIVGEFHEVPSVKHKHHKQGAPVAVQHFGNISVHIVSGEVTREKSDIIVTSVDKSLNLDKGKISQAVIRYGGQMIQAELNSQYSLGFAPGQIAVTSGGNLKCSNIFHTCLSNYNGEDAKQISKAVKEILKQADSLKATSISIPALGTGGLKYPADVSAHAIIDSIKNFAKYHKKSSLKKIHLVIHPKATDVKQTFEAAMAAGEESSDLATGIQQESNITINFGSVKLTVKQGDITEEKCNAIVIGLRENLNFISSGAVTKSVLNKCGSDLQEECQSHVEEFTSTGLMMTSGYKLFADCIIYVSMDKYSKSWSNGLTRALLKAEQNGIESLAFPAVGAGKRSADVDSIRDMVLNVVKKFGTGHRRTLTDIRLVIFSRDLMDAFISQGGYQTDSSDRACRTLLETSSAPCESINVTVCSLSAASCETAGEALTNACEVKYINKKEQEHTVKLLTCKQIKELQDLGLRHQLQVTVDVRESTICIQGFHLREGQLAILKKLREFDKAIADSQRKEHEEIPLAFQWQYKSRSKWRNFQPNSNSQLEIAHKRKSSHFDLVCENGHKYHIDFRTMKEFYVDDSGRSAESVDIQRVDRTKEEPLPKRWDFMDGDLKLVVLRTDSHEYRKVAKYFKDHGVTDDIKKIERVQNKTLYQQYAVKKRDIDARNPSGHDNEKRLFHGTDASNVDAICQNGFNRNYSGVNATMYGTGVYFAVESSYSVTFATADSSNNRKIFQARVLVGESVATSSTTRYLPMKPRSKHPYDSGVNSVSDPDIYVIFHDAQAYPEYLITF